MLLFARKRADFSADPSNKDLLLAGEESYRQGQGQGQERVGINDYEAEVMESVREGLDDLRSFHNAARQELVTYVTLLG